MTDQRIGNDIRVKWALVMKGTSDPFILSGKNVSLYLRGVTGKKKIEDFSVAGNAITWTFYGKDQKHTGVYSLILVVNEGVEGMVTTDACNFVNLVSCSCKTGGSDDCGVFTETIELTSTIEYGTQSVSIEVDSELSATSENPVQNKVITAELTKLSAEIEKLPTKEYVDEAIKNIPQGGGGSTTDLTAVAKWGVVTQTLKYVGNANDGYVVQVSNPVKGWIPQSFIDEATTMGGYYENNSDISNHISKEMPVFNADTGYFEYRGLTNLAYDEMQAAYFLGRILFTSSQGQYNIPVSYTSLANQRAKKLRCILHYALVTELGQYKLNGTFRKSYFLESSIFNTKLTEIAVTGDGLRYCYSQAFAIRDVGYYNATGLGRTFQGEFSNCYSLETAWLSNVNADIEFKDSPLFKYECIVYLIQNAKANSSFSITLHATALANAEAAYLEDTTQDHATYPTLSDWALSKNIQIATA